MAKVELKGIGKVYDGNVRAVDNANITIDDQEFVVLVGPRLEFCKAHLFALR